MFKKRKRKIAELEKLLEYLAEAKANISRDTNEPEAFKKARMAAVDNKAEALIDAIVAYGWMPIVVGFTVFVTTVFWGCIAAIFI